VQIDTVDFSFRASIQIKASWHAPPWCHGSDYGLDPARAADYHQQVCIGDGEKWPDADLWGPDPQATPSLPWPHHSLDAPWYMLVWLACRSTLRRNGARSKGCAHNGASDGNGWRYLAWACAVHFPPAVRPPVHPGASLLRNSDRLPLRCR
jgi:hypothetical protein